jgi:hypothetical protein
MALTVTYVENEAADGSYAEPTYHVSRGHELHHGMVSDDDYYEDEFGNIRNRYSDLDEDRVHQIEDQAFYGYEDEDAEPDDVELDAEYIHDLVGGQEHYQSMMNWAASNLDTEVIEQFDAVIDGGNMAEIEEAVQWLYEQYDGSSDEPSYSSEIEAAVYETYPEYQAMVAWAKESLSDSDIRAYDDVMESGDTDLIAQYVDQLAQLYYQN